MDDIKKPRWNIGDMVWGNRTEFSPVIEECPDCLGTAEWKVILPSGEEFGCECPRCYPGGYSQSTGQIKERYEFKVFSINVMIEGIEKEDGEFKYKTKLGWHMSETSLFDNEVDAFLHGEKQAEDHLNGEHAEMQRTARTKGRRNKRKHDDGTVSVDQSDGPRTIVYARSQMNRGIKDVLNWFDYGMRKKSEIKLSKANIAALKERGLI